VDIFLRYEISVRELDANILTGLIAASRGHRAIVCDWPMMMRGILLRHRQPGFVHMNSLTPGKSTSIFHSIFKFFGFQVSSMDQEAGIQRISYESFAEVRYAEETVSGADLIFCWGRDDCETLRRLYPKHGERIVMSGSPRVDLWRPRFASLYVKPERIVRPFVLVLSSLQGPLLRDRLHERLIRRRIDGYLDRHPEMESQLVGHYKEGADLMLAYLQLVRSLSLNFPGLEIIVKAHPGEDPEIWRGLLGKTDRVQVDKITPTSQLIRESMAVITSGSTAAFEVVLSDTPLVSFQPVETPHRDRGFADTLGFQAKTQEEVQAIVGGILRPELQKNFWPLPSSSRADVSRKVHYDDNQLAAERMVDSWERALKIGPQRSSKRSVLSTSIEERKYFVASAFPFLIPIFDRGRKTSRPAGSQQNHKRPPISRRALKVRVEEMRSILGLQDSVAYRFKGRRGLVIRPSHGDFSRG